MNKPKKAIERIRKCWLAANECPDRAAILAWADSIPDNAHICEWPKELTRERLEGLSLRAYHDDIKGALRALAAIAPVRKKRMVNLWQKGVDQTFADLECDNAYVLAGWQKMNHNGPIEIEE